MPAFCMDQAELKKGAFSSGTEGANKRYDVQAGCG